MARNYCIFIGRTTFLPPKPDGEEHEILYCLDDFNKVDDKTNDKIDLEYLVVVLYKTTEFVSTDKEYINAVWKELTNGDKDMFLELIETSRNKITKGFLQIFDSHDENEVVFKSPFVAFKNSSEQGYQSARNLIKKATLKKTWMLWR